MTNSDWQSTEKWVREVRVLTWVMVGLCVGTFVLLVVFLAHDTGKSDAAPVITTRQSCARLLAEVDMLDGEGARKDAATIRRVCAQLEAADADAVGMAITGGGT